MFRYFKNHKKLSLAGLGVLLTSGIAVAAFLLYSGASGTGTATVSGSSTVDALTFSAASAPSELSPGTSTPANFHVKNNDPSNGHTLLTLNGVVSSGSAGCASHITYSYSGSILFGTAWDSDTTVGTLSTDSSLPVSCAGASISIALSGTTSP